MYRFVSFDGVALPTLRPTDDLSTPQSESAIAQALNGNVDVLGSTRANNKPQTFEYNAMYRIDTTYEGFLVDELGNNLSTQNGYWLWTGSQVIETIDGWARRRGMRGVLIRQRDVDGTRQWKYARLVYAEMSRKIENVDKVLPMRFVFEVANDRWLAMEQTVVSADLALNAATVIPIAVNSLVNIENPIITISNNSGSTNINLIEILNNSNQHLLWTATVSPYAYNPVPANSSIIFNCEAFTVVGGLGYIGFSLHGLHTAQNWIELSPGNNSMTIAITGGPARATISFYEQVM